MYSYVYKWGFVPCSKEEFVLNNTPLKKSFVLTGLLTIAAVILRAVLQFTAIDHSTGFYHSGVVEIIFNVFLLAAVVLIWLSVRRFGKEVSDQPKRFSSEFFIGLMLMGFTAELSYLFPLPDRDPRSAERRRPLLALCPSRNYLCYRRCAAALPGPVGYFG